MVAFTSEEFVAIALVALSPAGQPLFCRATRARSTMPHQVTEPGLRSTSRSDKCIDLSSPTSCAPETTNQFSSSSSSVASKSSDAAWEPSGSECPDGDAPILLDLEEDADDDSLPTQGGDDPKLLNLQQNADHDSNPTYGGLLSDLFKKQRDVCRWVTGQLNVTFAKSRMGSCVCVKA